MDKEIDRLIATLEELQPGSTQYQAVLEQLKTLKNISNEAQKTEMETNEHIIKTLNESQSRVLGVSKDEIAKIVGNMLSLVLVLQYEKAGIITSKAFQMLRR